MWRLAGNYFKIISHAYCASQIFTNMFDVAEIGNNFRMKGGLDQYRPGCFGRLIFATIRKSVGLKGLTNWIVSSFITETATNSWVSQHVDVI